MLKATGYVAKWLCAMDKENEPRFKNLGTKCSEARRMFWLGRSIAEYQKLKDALSASKKDGFVITIEWVVLMIAKVGLICRYLFENYIILAKAKLFNPKDLKEIVRICSKFWFIGVGGTYLSNLIKFIKTQICLMSTQCEKERATMYKKRNDTLYTLVASLGDATNSATGSAFLPTVFGITPTPLFISSVGMVGGLMQVNKNYSATK